MQPMIRVTGQKKSISASHLTQNHLISFRLMLLLCSELQALQGGDDEMCFNEYLFGIFESS